MDDTSVLEKMIYRKRAVVASVLIQVIVSSSAVRTGSEQMNIRILNSGNLSLRIDKNIVDSFCIFRSFAALCEIVRRLESCGRHGHNIADIVNRMDTSVDTAALFDIKSSLNSLCIFKQLFILRCAEKNKSVERNADIFQLFEIFVKIEEDICGCQSCRFDLCANSFGFGIEL